MKQLLLLLTFLIPFVTFAQKHSKVIKEGEQYGIERMDQIVVPAQYDEARILGGCDEVYFAVRKGNKWALWIHRKQATEFVFDDLIPYNEYFDIPYKGAEIAIAKEGENLGIIQIDDCRSAPYVIPPKYRSISIEKHFKFSNLDCLRCVTHANTIDFYYRQGNFESLDYADFISGYNELIPIENKSELYLAYVRKDEKWGMVNFSKEIIPCEYDRLEAIIDQDAMYSAYIISHRNNKVNLHIYGAYNDPVVKLFREDVDDLMLNTKAEDLSMITAFKRDGVWNLLHDGSRRAYNQRNHEFEHKGLRTVLGYDSVYIDNEECAWVQKNGMWALYLCNYYASEYLLGFDYRKPKNSTRQKNRFPDEQIALDEQRSIIKKNGFYGFMDHEAFFPPVYDTVMALPQQGFIVQLGEAYGLVIKNHESLIIYDSIEHITHIDSNLFKLWKGDQYALWNVHKNVWTDQLFDSVQIVTPDQFITWRDGLCGAMTSRDKNHNPVYTHIDIPLEGKDLLFKWTDDQFSISTDGGQHLEELYKSWAYGSAKLPLVFVEDSAGWIVCNRFGPLLDRYSKSFEDLEASTWKRYMRWELGLKESGIEKDSVNREIFALSYSSGLRLVYASRLKAALGEEWLYHLHHGWIDSFEMTSETYARQSIYKIHRDNLYTLCSASEAMPERITQTWFKDIHFDDSSSTYILTRPDGKLTLFNPYRDYMKTVRFYDTVKKVEGVTGLWIATNNGLTGAELLNPKLSGRPVQIECKYNDIHFLRNNKLNGYSLFIFQNGEHYGILKFNRYYSQTRLTKAHYKSLKRASRKATRKPKRKFKPAP